LLRAVPIDDEGQNDPPKRQSIFSTSCAWSNTNRSTLIRRPSVD
jgi:hypothetical protein